MKGSGRFQLLGDLPCWGVADDAEAEQAVDDELREQLGDASPPPIVALIRKPEQD